MSTTAKLIKEKTKAILSKFNSKFVKKLTNCKQNLLTPIYDLIFILNDSVN